MITVSKKTCNYNGKAQKPAVTSVKLAGKTLTLGTDYTVSYKNNKNIGKATITITGKGTYTGKATAAFNIAAKKGSIFNVSANKYKVTVGSIEIKAANLKKVGKNALKGIKAAAKIKVPAKKLNTYKKLLKGKGQDKKVKITK